MTSIDQVLDAFMHAWNSGERPDVHAHLDRVPEPQQPELARLIEEFLLVAPTPDYDEATLADIAADPVLMQALAAGEAAVQPWATRVRALREKAGLALGDVAERITASVGLGDAQRPRAEAYLAQIERSELDERRVSQRLVSALAAALGVDRDALRPSWGPPVLAAPSSPGTLKFRRADGTVDDAALGESLDIIARAGAMRAPADALAPLDELDELFLGGPDA